MQFQLTVTVDVPDELDRAIPEELDSRSEFVEVVNRSVSASVQAWAMTKLAKIDSSASRIEAMPDGSVFRTVQDGKIH